MLMDPRYVWHELAPSLTERQKVALVRVMEECAELQHAAAKALRFGMDSYDPKLDNPQDRCQPTNRMQMRREFDDLCQVAADLLL